MLCLLWEQTKLYWPTRWCPPSVLVIIGQELYVCNICSLWHELGKYLQNTTHSLPTHIRVVQNCLNCSNISVWAHAEVCWDYSRTFKCLKIGAGSNLITWPYGQVEEKDLYHIKDVFVHMIKQAAAAAEQQKPRSVFCPISVACHQLLSPVFCSSKLLELHNIT